MSHSEHTVVIALIVELAITLYSSLDFRRCNVLISDLYISEVQIDSDMEDKYKEI